MQLLSLGELCERTGYSRWTILRHRKRYPDYPKPVGRNGDCPRFVEEEINAFYLARRQNR